MVGQPCSLGFVGLVVDGLVVVVGLVVVLVVVVVVAVAVLVAVAVAVVFVAVVVVVVVVVVVSVCGGSLACWLVSGLLANSCFAEQSKTRREERGERREERGSSISRQQPASLRFASKAKQAMQSKGKQS